MLGRSAKLHWGLGHKAIKKTFYEGALIPILTYGAPVWEEALGRQKYLSTLQRTQRLINITTAKAFRTISFEASCVMAGVPPIGNVIERKVRNYKATHSNTEYDAPLGVRYWNHPAEIPLIRVPKDIPHNATTIFTDGSKIRGKE